jgi:hypothetical protein
VSLVLNEETATGLVQSVVETVFAIVWSKRPAVAATTTEVSTAFAHPAMASSGCGTSGALEDGGLCLVPSLVPPSLRADDPHAPAASRAEPTEPADCSATLPTPWWAEARVIDSGGIITAELAKRVTVIVPLPPDALKSWLDGEIA